MEKKKSGQGLDKTSLLRHNKMLEKPVDEKEEVKVTAGVIERVVDLAFNATRDKIREVTSIDRIQARLLPQLDIIGLAWGYCIEVAMFRQDAAEYERVYGRQRPAPPDLIEEFTYRTAQWQKSIAGTNLKAAIDIALAETEARMGEEEGLGGEDPYGKD